MVVCRALTGSPSHSLAKVHLVLQGAKDPHAAAATLDRYSTIRKYFRRKPSSSRATSSHCFVPRHSLYAVGTISFQCSGGAVSAAFSRTFHSARHYQAENKQESLQCEKDLHRSAQTQKQSAPNLDNYSSFFKRLALSLPHLPRPTQDDFLNVTTSFWQRIRIRFKWFTIKSFRKWNADDISAFFTWFLMTQTVWILVGT